MENLDAPLLRKILSFLGSAQDFRNCEKTNKAWKAVLKDDKVWSLCEECKPENYPDLPYLNRELALIPIALQKIKKWQNHEEHPSVILDVLTESGWKNLLHNILNNEPHGGDTGIHPGHDNSWHTFEPLLEDHNAHIFEVRGDTSAVLLAIVEESLHKQLRSAHALTLHRQLRAPTEVKLCPITNFPTLLCMDYKLQSALSCDSSDLITAEVEEFVWNVQFEDVPGDTLAGTGIDPATRDRLVSCMAFRAGIIKMEYDMYPLIWAVLCQTILDILKPACYALVEEVDVRELRRHSWSDPNPTLPKRQVVVSGISSVNQIIRKIPPLPRLVPDTCCPICHRIPVVFTLVPSHVEAGAHRMGMMTSKVLGDEWHVSEDDNATNKEEARQEAMSYYTFVEKMDIDVEQELPIQGVPPTSGLHFPMPTEDEDDGSYETNDKEVEDDEDLPDVLSPGEGGVNEAFAVKYDDDYDPSSCLHEWGFVPISSPSD